MKTKEEILKKAEDLHYDLLQIETEIGEDELPEEHVDLTLEIAYLMRDFIHEKHHKTYFNVPNTKDFYSDSVGEIELDPGIAESIKILNDKGYVTVASCSGHNNCKCGYIWIANFPNKRVPNGFTKDKSTAGAGHCIRWGSKDNRTELKNMKQLEIKWVELRYWCESLPSIKV